MTRDTIYKIAFGFFLSCMLTGLVFQILHYPYSAIILLVAIAAAIIYSTIALMEIWSSKQIQTADKLMWTAGFLTINSVAGLLYFFNQRKKILETPPL